jgi:hypothetical protein
MNCFGKVSRDSGHTRVPAPPHMITGNIFTQNLAARLVRYARRGKRAPPKPREYARSQLTGKRLAGRTAPLGERPYELLKRDSIPG